MNIDLTKLVTNNVDAISVSIDVNYDADKLESVNIRKLKDVSFTGKVKKIYDNDYELEGILSGIMVLPDDITLEDVEVEFSVSLLENFGEQGNEEENILVIDNNILEISDYLWQNIVLEIPSKVVSEKNKNLTLKGDGWRFVTEEELEKEKSSKSPFSELDDKF